MTDTIETDKELSKLVLSDALDNLNGRAAQVTEAKQRLYDNAVDDFLATFQVIFNSYPSIHGFRWRQMTGRYDDNNYHGFEVDDVEVLVIRRNVVKGETKNYAGETVPIAEYCFEYETSDAEGTDSVDEQDDLLFTRSYDLETRFETIQGVPGDELQRIVQVVNSFATTLAEAFEARWGANQRITVLNDGVHTEYYDSY